MLIRSLVAGVVAVTALAAAAPAARADDLVTFGAGGLRRGSAVLVTGAIDSAAHDPRLDLVWFVAGGKLQVLDLRAPSPKPVAIVSRVPDDTSFVIRGASTAAWNPNYTDVAMVLDLGRTPRLVTENGAYDQVDPDVTRAHRKAIKRATVVGKRWLATLARRAPRADVVPAPAAAARVSPPAGMCGGDYATDPDGCGDATSFGGTKLQLVEVVMACGDACHSECALYDPARKLWASPLGSAWGKTASTASCDGYVFARDGVHYANAGYTCTLGATVTCAKDEAWLAVGYDAPPPPPAP